MTRNEKLAKIISECIRQALALRGRLESLKPASYWIEWMPNIGRNEESYGVFREDVKWEEWSDDDSLRFATNLTEFYSTWKPVGFGLSCHAPGAREVGLGGGKETSSRVEIKMRFPPIYLN